MYLQSNYIHIYGQWAWLGTISTKKNPSNYLSKSVVPGIGLNFASSPPAMLMSSLVKYSLTGHKTTSKRYMNIWVEVLWFIRSVWLRTDFEVKDINIYRSLKKKGISKSCELAVSPPPFPLFSYKWRLQQILYALWLKDLIVNLFLLWQGVQ